VEKYGTARQATDDNIIRCMRFACRINKATDRHSEYVILIAFPRQQWLRERAPMLRYTHIACRAYFQNAVHFLGACVNVILFKPVSEVRSCLPRSPQTS
jgi:hypothetical protein